MGAAVLRISRHMGLNTEGVQLTSWKKTALWLQAQSVLADLFGALQIEHSLDRMETGIAMTPAQLAAAPTEELQERATHYMVGEELGEMEFSRLRQLAEGKGWRAAGAALPSREELHQWAFPENHATILQTLAGMQRDALQSYIQTMSAEWRQRYIQNRDAILSYLEMMEDREELAKDAALRAGVNAMVRLVRDYGCDRQKYFDTVKGGYDWEAAAVEDRAVFAALQAGCDLEELLATVRVDGRIDVGKVEEAREAVSPRLGFTPEQREAALSCMEGEVLGAPIRLSGETLTDAEVDRVKQGRLRRAEGIFAEFALWEEKLFLGVCEVCRRLVLQDEKVGNCKSIGEKLVRDQADSVLKCTDCAAARVSARQKQREREKAGNTEPLHPGMLDPWGPDNNMRPGPVPDVLKQLSMVEMLMVSLITPMMRIKFLRAGTRALHGNGIAFRQPVENLARALPRYVSETRILLVVRGLVDDEQKLTIQQEAKQWKVRRAPVRAALEWLLENNPAYRASNVVIDDARLQSIPEDGSVFDAARGETRARVFQSWAGGGQGAGCLQCGEDKARCTCYLTLLGDEGNAEAPGGEDGDLGPAPEQAGIGSDGAEDDCDEFGKIDVGDLHLEQEGAVRSSLLRLGGDSSAVVNLQVGQEDKVSEVNTPWYWTLSHPDMFPDGKGDITAPNLTHGFDTKSCSTADLKRWLKIMLSHEDGRFAESPSFPFLALNMFQRRQAKGGAIAWRRKRLDAEDPSLEDVAKAGLDSLNGMFKSVFAQTANIRGTRAYWGDTRRVLDAILNHQIHRGASIPSFFISGSCAEFHHASLASLIAEAESRKPGARSAQEISEQMKTDENYRRSLVKKHSLLVCRYFEIKTRQFIDSVLDPALDIIDYFLRFEFAKGRGQIHLHLLGIRRDRLPHTLFQEADGNFEKFERLLLEFLEGLGFDCRAPAGAWPAPEGDRAGPSDQNVLRRSFQDIRDCAEKRADIDWMLRQHICSDYCLARVGSKRRRADGTVGRDVRCRFFGVPKARMGRVEGRRGHYVLQRDRPGAKRCRLFKNHKGVLSFQMPYDHPRLLQEPMMFTQLWRANMDFSPVLTMDNPDAPCHADTADIASYVVKYATKENPESAASLQMYKDHTQVLAEQQPGRPLSSLAQTLMAASVGEREVPLQQALFEGYGCPLWISSFRTNRV